MNPLMKQKFLNQYQQTSLETGLENASPHKLVSMLYDGALETMANAKGAIERKDYETKAHNLNRAILIIGTLRSGLDMENGGEVANNYAELYGYINQKLLHVSFKNDLEALADVMDLIRDLRDSWNLMPDNMKSATKDQLENLKKMKASRG
ncbi:MAG: flagellar export chaperone FliS [Thiotrichales bacterium]|jgi:flagellar protein FliS|nr:flagellar export chaperone FliS [Thiotrichales bacterium]